MVTEAETQELRGQSRGGHAKKHSTMMHTNFIGIYL